MDLSKIKKLLPYALPYKKYAFLNIFFNMLYALFSSLSFVALIPMLEVLFSETQRVVEPPQYTSLVEISTYLKQYLHYYVSGLAKSKVDALTTIIGLILVLFLLKNLFNYLAIVFIHYLRNGVLKDLRNVMYQKIVSLPLSYFSHRRKGDMVSRITGDIFEFQHSYLSILELIVREPLTILFTIAIMFGISVKLTIFVFIFIPLSGIVISKVGKSLKKHSTRLQQENGYFLSIIDETISGLRIVKAFNGEGFFVDKFGASTQRLYNQSNGLSKRNNLGSPLSEFLGIGVIGVLLWFGGRMVLVEGTLSGSEFIAYMGLAYNILTPAKAISKASYQLRTGAAAADRVFEVLNAENNLIDKSNALKKQDFTDNIAINNISFKYEEDFVLKDFTLKIEKGQTIALVGQSGSGKSTIANLITRFYDVSQGEICFDGINIKDITQKSLRDLIGVVSQDSILFNDTIEGNLRLGKQDATEQEMIDALVVANAWDFVKALPKGLQTSIGDLGNTLSGGQKQRLNIARAVLKNPPIMMLDEATSALDTQSERLVQDALEKMMRNRTSIVIAHRLSTIQNADLIVVMQQGRIVEQGNHQTLIQKEGIYKKLVEMQTI